MTDAEKFVESGKVPDDFATPVAAMVEQHRIALAEIERLGPDATVPMVRHARDETGEVVYDPNGEPLLVNVTDDNGVQLTDPHPLIHRVNNQGIHAYRYEEMPDRSVVAIYVKNDDLTPKMKAFADIEEASAWSPRDE